MSKTRQIGANVFTGGLDTDSDPLVVEQQDYIDAYDILNGYGGQIGAVTFFRGNTKVPYTLPAGINKCIGCPEDKQTASAFMFIYNSNDDHLVLWWKPNDPTEDVRVLASGAALNFSITQFISQVATVDGKLLYWTDGQYLQGTLRGNPPRQLDYPTADNTEKDKIYEVYAGQPGEGQFADGNEYIWEIQNAAGDVLINLDIFADGTYFNDPAGGLDWIKGQMESTGFGDYVSVEYCECKLTVTLLYDTLPTGYDRIIFTSVSATQGDVLWVGINFYPDPLESYHIDMAKQPAYCAPSAIYVQSDITTQNSVASLCAQFAVRYIYRNGEQSSWSPYSNVALNTNFAGEVLDDLNAIEVDFSDERLKDPSWLFLIRAVEVAFRDGNTNEFKLIDRYDVCEIGILRQKILFLNDKLYQNVESDDVSTSADTQVLKLFDNIPIKCGALAMASDSNGVNRMFLGSNLEGYKNPDCVEMTAEAVPWEEECLISIRGTVEIINNAAYPSADPDYSAYPLDGFVVYLAGTNYFAISHNPADGSGDGSFVIPDVPKGKYILRVASYKCSFTDDLGIRYNLSNGLEWQRTSAPVVDCAGSVASGLNQFERFLDITGATNEFDLDTEVGYGPIQVLNAHYSHRDPEVEDGDTVTNMHEMYVLDNEALDTDVNTRIGALNCERQQIHFDGSSSVDLDTDHNGYAYKLDVYTKGSPAADVTITVENIEVVPLRLIMYRGDYKEMYDDTLIVTTDPGTIYESWGGGNYFIFNLDESFTNRKRVLQTTAEEADGSPLSGVLFVFSRTTRVAVTADDGIARILCYAQYDDNYRLDDYLIANYADDICYEDYPDVNPVDVEYFRIVYVIGMNVDPFDVDPFEFTLTGGIARGERFLKAGGVYDFGVVYEDTMNRTPGVAKGFRLHVPFHVGGLTRYQAKWSISSLPPDWAHHFRIVRTKNALHQTFVQWSASEVRYVRIPSQLENPVDTTYENGNATHIMFRLFVQSPTAETPALKLFWNQDGQEGYYPQEGDLLRLILDSTGNAVNTNELLYQSPIVGVYIDAEKVYAVVPNDFGTLEVTDGFLVEYMTPRKNAEEIYYEGGEDCYEIIDPYTNSRRHSGPIQDQTIVDPIVPAIGLVKGGDTYWRRSLYTDTTYITEHYTPNRLLTQPCEDIGRPFIYDGDADQIYFYNRIRFSGAYVPNSKINDLSSYGAFDYQDINRQFGHIRWLGLVNNVLLAVCQFKVQPLYLAQYQLLDLGGETSVGRSDRVLNIANASVSSLGSNDPASIVVEDGRVFGWDGYNGVPWQYSQAGVESIADKNNRFFRDLARSRSENVPDVIIGGFDRRHATYVLAGLGTEKSAAFCMGYDVVKGMWYSKFNYLPEMMGRVGQEFVSFKDGEMWRHHVSGLYSNWYGVQYKPKITFVCNAVPGAVKLFYSLRLITNRLWSMPTITIPRNMDYNSGMLSRLKANKFKKYEGIFAADFLRDMLDTSPQYLAIPDITLRQNTSLLSGRNLRGNLIIMTLEADNGAVATLLERVDTYFIPSEETNS